MWQIFGTEDARIVEATCSCCHARITRGLMCMSGVAFCFGCAYEMLKTVWKVAA